MVNVINVSILCINITKLSFVCMCIKIDFSYFQNKLVILIRGMFRKKKNASSNLKKGLHLGKKIKSNGCLDIGTEGVFNICNH